MKLPVFVDSDHCGVVSTGLVFFPKQIETQQFLKACIMWIIVVLIVALGAGTMTYRSVAGSRAEPAKPSAATSQTTLGEAIPAYQIDPAARPSAGSNPGPG
jgi:hypothetical protein